MLSCHDVCNSAQEYSDGRLGRLRRLRIRLHLLACRNCRAFMDQTRQTARILRQTVARDPVPGVDPELIAAFRKRHAQAAAPTRAPAKPGHPSGEET